MAEVKFPTEVVDLPSKGLLYPEDSSISTGKVEVRYMTAKDEDILITGVNDLFYGLPRPLPKLPRVPSGV